MRCDITTRDLTKRQGVFHGQPVNIVQPAIAPVLKASITLMLDNQEVIVEIEAPEMMLATDHYDNHANAKRVIEQMVDLAFRRFLQ